MITKTVQHLDHFPVDHIIPHILRKISNKSSQSLALTARQAIIVVFPLIIRSSGLNQLSTFSGITNHSHSYKDIIRKEMLTLWYTFKNVSLNPICSYKEFFPIIILGYLGRCRGGLRSIVMPFLNKFPIPTLCAYYLGSSISMLE